MPYISIDNFFLTSPSGSLHYHKYGNGKKILLVFHGFGQNHTIATPLAELLNEEYTIYSFDLPYHGQSIWEEKEIILTKKHVLDIFSKWFEEQRITYFSVLGYSMGGKFALSLTEAFPPQVQQLILVAPDGLYKSIWYRLATSFPVKSLFKLIIHRPAFFFMFTKFISKTGIISVKLIQFAESHMTTSELRKQVYYTWVNFQKLYTHRKTLETLTNEQNVIVSLILGEKDRVINPKVITSIVSNINQVRLDILPARHSRLIQESMSLLKKYLQEN